MRRGRGQHTRHTLTWEELCCHTAVAAENTTPRVEPVARAVGIGRGIEPATGVRYRDDLLVAFEGASLGIRDGVPNHSGKKQDYPVAGMWYGVGLKLYWSFPRGFSAPHHHYPQVFEMPTTRDAVRRGTVHRQYALCLATWL